MARMAIDDMVSRDPRIVQLAKLAGWSRRETVGALILDVWPLCYDRRTPILSVTDIDTAAGVDGFALLLVQSGLATRVQLRGRVREVRINGAEQRIEYLNNLAGYGREGGIKSAEVRRKKRESQQSPPKPGLPKNEAATNLLPLVPVPVPSGSPSGDLVSAPDARARSIPPSGVPAALPSTWQPTAELAEAAVRLGLDPDFECRKFALHARTHGRQAVDWNAAFEGWLLDGHRRKAAVTAPANAFDAVMRIANGVDP